MSQKRLCLGEYGGQRKSEETGGLGRYAGSDDSVAYSCRSSKPRLWTEIGNGGVAIAEKGYHNSYGRGRIGRK